MIEKKFKFQKNVPRRSADVIQLETVMAPLYGKAGLTEVVDSTTKLVNRWRVRLKNLVDVGWNMDQDRSRYTYMINCHPAFCLRDTEKDKSPNTGTCGKTFPCPFCYARQVRQDYIRIQSNCGAATPVTQVEGREIREIMLDRNDRSEYAHATEFNYNIVERVARYRYSILCKYDNGELIPLDGEYGVCDYVYKQTAKHRTAFRSLLEKRLGGDFLGYCGNTVMYKASGDRDEIHVLHRQLIKIRSGAAFPLEAVEKANVTVHERPCRTTLHNAIKKLWRYPVEWLNGDATITAALLNNRNGFRLFTKCGCFRQTRKYEE